MINNNIAVDYDLNGEPMILPINYGSAVVL